MEEGLDLRQAQARQRAEEQRAEDLEDRVDDDGVDVHDPARESARDAEGHGEDDQTHRVVERDDRQQQVGELSLGLVLAHDHQRGGGRGGGRDRAERDGGRDGEGLREQEVQPQQRRVHDERRDESLQDADHQRLSAGLAQLGEAELVADGEGDEAQRHVRDRAERLELVKAGKAQARDVQRAEHAGADQHARDKVGRHVRQFELVAQTREHQPREHGHGDIQKLVQKKHLFSLYFQQPAHYTAAA